MFDDSVLCRFQNGMIRERMVHLLDVSKETPALHVVSWHLALIVSCTIIIANCIVARLVSGAARFVVIVDSR